jgi:ABC-type uncharacterized transport system substrate-binding protein
LINPGNPQIRSLLADVQAAAEAMGQQLEIIAAATTRDISPAFSEAVRKQADALLIQPDPMFVNRLVQLATLASRHALPAIYALREFAEAGGLMSYGSNFTDVFRQAGTYAGRILKGEKPADLPILQVTKFDLVVNSQHGQGARPHDPRDILGPRRPSDRITLHGPNFPELWRRAGDYVDKVLRGAKPADLPVEQPTKFDLAINLTTARALGLEVPPTLLALAYEVIE